MKNVLEKVLFASSVRAGAAAGVVIGFALISAWLTPRGPITTVETLVTMTASLMLGLVVGFLTGNPWSIFITPLVYVGVFEVARIGVDGPTVDSIHLGSTYGIIAFVLGRVAHGLFALVPMMLGTSFGILLAGRLGESSVMKMGPITKGTTIILSLVWVVLVYFIAQPAKTHPILGSDGAPVPGSVAELTAVRIGGHDQTLMIRGRSSENPVLLYLAGGPGGTDIGAVRADVSLEQDFVVAAWDQRGAGKSYAALDPADTLTVDQMVADTVEVTDYLRERFDEEKIYLVGNSWGTILGILTVQQYPDRYHAFIGTGQMVSPRETDIMFYEDTLKWAEQTGSEKLAATLTENGLPSYENLLDYEPAISHEHDWNAYPELDMSKEMPAILFVPENNFMDRINGFRGFLDTFAVLYPQLQEIDFRHDVPELAVPFYVVMGEHEARGRAVLAREWFNMLEAPHKEMVVFEHSGHRPLFEEPGNFASLMTRVLEETTSSK